MPPSSKQSAATAAAAASRSSIPPNVIAASTSLESSVKSFLTKQHKKRLRKQHGGGEGSDDELNTDEERNLKRWERTATHAAGHGSHILQSLVIKRRALDLGVAALEECTNQCLAALEEGYACDNLQSTLQHYFTNYLRLRDGLVLLTSGECRHPGDSRQAKSTQQKYKSSFGTDSTVRGDGYTTLFSAEGGYSGTGWDEFYDEHLGARTRIVDACLGCVGVQQPTPSRGWGGNRVKVWERLCELGAETFETELDAHDTQIKATEARLESVRRRFFDGVNTILARTTTKRASKADGRGAGAGGRGGKLTMVTTDKFERMELQNAASLGISSLVIERRGDNFCVSDDEGVLPSDWDRRSWKEAMKLPNVLLPKTNSEAKSEKRSSSTASSCAVLQKKRRIIVEDSDSDSDAGDGNNAKKMQEPVKQEGKSRTSKAAAAAPSAPKAGGGLKVKVKSIDNSSTSPTAGDINQIKASLGVDVEALARGREDFEEEQKRSAAVAVAEEAATAAWMHPAAFMTTTITARVGEVMESITQLREDMKRGERILRLVDQSKTEVVSADAIARMVNVALFSPN